MDTKEDIAVKGKLSIDDLKLFNRIHMKNKYVKIMLIVFVAFLVIFGVTFSQEQGGIIDVLVFALCGSLAVWITLLISTKFVVKSAFKSNPLVKYEQTYIINEKEIAMQSERGYSIYKWDDICKVIEYNDTFILYVSKSMAIVIPQRFFTDKSKIVDLKQLISKCTQCKSNINLSI